MKPWLWSKSTATAVLLLAAVAATLSVWQAPAAASRFTTEGGLATHTPAARAQIEAGRIGIPRPDLVLLVSDPAGSRIDTPRNTRKIAALTRTVAGRPDVAAASSPATQDQPTLLSQNRVTAMIQAQVDGTPRQRAHHAGHILSAAQQTAHGLRVRATGTAWTTRALDRRVESDLLHAELWAAPAVALLLLSMYGSLPAALLPVLIAALSVLCTLPVLGILARATDISQFAVNAASAVGFALAVDYTLFILARYREHLTHHTNRTTALALALRTSGRTVIFSAATVTAALTAAALIPIPLLRALSLAAISVSLLSALAAWTVLPACLLLLGPHLERCDPLARWRRHHLGQPSRTWRTVAQHVTARPLLAGAAALALLTVCALPVLHLRPGASDDRSLPPNDQAAVTAQQLRTDFAFPPERLLTVLVHADPPTLTAYRTRIMGLPHITGVFPTGRYTPHEPAPTATVVVASDTAPDTPAAADLVRALRRTAPAGDTLVAGRAADIADTTHAVRKALPGAALLLTAALVVLLTLYTRSVIAPLKTLAVGLITMGAGLGAVVAVFQDGHGQTLIGGFTQASTVDCPVILFVLVLALAVSLDYEVFLLGRIKEEYDRHGDNTTSIIEGISRTGRLMTSAAVSVAITTAALAATGVTALKIIGLGLALTVVIDAVIIRGVLVPAAMTVLGTRNWWQPRHSRRLYCLRREPAADLRTETWRRNS